MSDYEVKEVDGTRYRAVRTPDTSLGRPAYRWESEDGATLPMTDEELEPLVHRDRMREITEP